MANDKSVELSQGFEVLAPKGGKAFPILCSEWDTIRDQIGALELEPWGFQFIGSLLLGIAGGAGLGLLSGSISKEENYVVITWAVFATSFLAGLFALFFASKEKKMHRTKAQNVKKQMQLIEERFDRSAAVANPVSAARALTMKALREMGAFTVSAPPPQPKT